MVIPATGFYCASKFALEGFSESLSYELASQNIIVKIIEPGGVVSTNFGKRSGAEAAQNAASEISATLLWQEWQTIGKARLLFIDTIDAALREGFLPAAPDAGECRWCDYRRVCGPYEEQRVKNKPGGDKDRPGATPGRMDALWKLRAQP